VAQSAWRVFPSDVDLSQATSPLDVLKAFVGVFGEIIRIGNQAGKFIEKETYYGDAGSLVSMMIPSLRSANFFASVSHVLTTTPGVTNVGVAYCIDMAKYKSAMREHGFNV
jgi:hypothetical protein